ncbi:hypothetical protein GOP47_0028151 [Adiantum capillus-veneris]|nr:hypothetical protein GOP47_0028151 [Adiantum capillus-veneris]
MSALPAGKRPLSDIAREAEANGRASKRRTPQKRAASPPSSSPLSPLKRGETVYRILCPASKTGSIIGKAGSIIKSIRQDTGAMIRIEDAVYGCDERVVTVSAKEEGFRPQKFRGPGNYQKSGDGDEDKDDLMSDTDEEEEQPAEAIGQASEEKTEGTTGLVEEKLDEEKLLQAESDKEKLKEAESDKEQLPEADSDKEKLTEAEPEKEKSMETEMEMPTEAEQENTDVKNSAGDEKLAEAAEKEPTEVIAAKPEQVEGNSNEVISESMEGGKENGKEEVTHLLAESGMDPKERGLSPVQEALLRVHLRILEADPLKPEEIDAERGQEIVTRLLVPTSQVGCLLGKQGKIVSQMREESGAQIRVLPKDQLPICASRADEVVQITGDLTAVRKALLAVSTQLRNNPPKKPGEDPKAVSRLPEEFSRKSGGLRAKKALGRSPPRHSLGQSAGLSLSLGEGEVTFRIMCPKEKIGSIIGKGGSIVQSIREETGAKISIDVSSKVGDERVIRVSALETLDDAFSKAQRAVMILHSRILAADQDKDGLVTIKLLVPADQAGCLLGKGGSIVIEMRKSTRAKIHIYGKEHLPPCALRTDELVEVVGKFNAAHEALMQITTRLRNNLFHGAAAGPGFGPAFKDAKLPSFSGLASPNEGPLASRTQMMPAPAPYERYRAPYQDVLSGLTGPYSHGTWPSQPVQTYAQEVRSKALPDLLGLGHTRELGVEPKRANTAFITSQTVEVIVPEHTINSIVGESGSNLQQICKISGARVKVNGVTPGALERVVEISGTPDQTHAAQSLLQAFILSGQ